VSERLSSQEEASKDNKKQKKEKKKKSDKKESVDTSSSAKKESKSKSKSSGGDSLNLLDLDFGSVSIAPEPSKPAAPTSAPVASDTGGKKKSKEKSSKKDQAWLTFHTGKCFDVLYFLGDSSQSGTKKVLFRLVNRGPMGMSISADANFKSFAPYQSVTGNTVRLAHHAPFGSETDSSIELGSGDTAPVSNSHLSATIRIMLETASGVETLNANATLTIPVSATFVPNVIDEDVFTASVAKSSSRWGSANAQVVSSLKPKYSFRAIGNFLRAHIVEAEPSKAASYSAKTATGAKVFGLAKVSKDGSSVTVEVKVLASSKPESQTIADALASALGELSL